MIGGGNGKDVEQTLIRIEKKSCSRTGSYDKKLVRRLFLTPSLFKITLQRKQLSPMRHARRLNIDAQYCVLAA